MESKPPRPARWVLFSSLVIAAVLGIVVYDLARSPKSNLVSSPTAVRPWAEAEFLRLTKPVPSPDSPLHPQYLARHGGPLPPTDPNFKARIVIDLPSTGFVPKYEVIEFDTADGFASGTRRGKIRWIGAMPFDLPDDLDAVNPSIMDVFHADGTPMTYDDTTATGITRRDREAWGLEQNGEGGTAMRWLLELDGFTNLQWKFQHVFDANTHVPVQKLSSSVFQTGDGLVLSAGLAVLHDAALIAVIDLAHGEVQSFDIAVSRGAKVSHADFQMEVIDILEGTVGHGRTEMIRGGKSVDQQCGVNRLSGAPASFSVIYQINPPVMGTAISVEAFDAAGVELKSHGKFMEHAPVSKFAAPLASAATLRIRYRPHQTRLLMRMKSVPGVAAPNLKPSNLFDVAATKVTFQDSFQMRRFISTGTQLKDITGGWSHDTPAAFPMKLENATPRLVAERYLGLDSNRKIRIDPIAMTVEFEQPKKPSFVSKILDWLKRRI